MSELMERLRNGDKAAFEEMVESYRTLACRRAAALTRSWQDAEDLVQEAFTRAWSKVSEFRGDASFSTWLLRIMENYHIDTQRKNRKVTLVSLQTMPFSEMIRAHTPSWFDISALENKWEIEDLRKCLEDAFSKLPSIYSTLIILKDVQELSYEEMAESMACSVESIRCKLYRARKQLRTELVALLGQHGLAL